MTESGAAASKPTFEGKMFLYDQPELLTREDHGNLGFSNVERPFDFVRTVKAVPLVSVEFRTAQHDYPIVFSDTEVPMPMAMVGVVDDVNLFVDESGNWERGRYLPSYIRCHPVGFAAGPNDQFAVIIDRASASISSQPDEPFFDGEKLSAAMQARVDFCNRYNAERRSTQAFCTRLKELDLFSGKQLSHRPPGGTEDKVIGTFVAVDVEKLGNLASDVVHRLHREGLLSVIYAHVFSLDNWSRLLERRAQRESVTPKSGTPEA